MDAYFDIFSGISGNMILGTLLDAGLELQTLKDELAKLGLASEYQFEIKKVSKHGITGTHVNIKLLKQAEEGEHAHCEHHHQTADNQHEHNHNHDHHNHDHQHQMNHEHHEHNHNHDHHDHDHHHQMDHEHHSEHHEHQPEHHHHSHHNHQHSHAGGRNFPGIKEIIENSDLSDGVKEKSIAIFHNLAVAEAKIHGKEVAEIHFHEVGAVDAIVDIVGSVIGLEMMGIDKIYASRIHTGTGFVNCQHGLMPVPAPATMELLKDVPIYSQGIESELVTPTGAAIITTLADYFGPRPEMEINKTGYGAGTKDLEIPNMLRLNLGQVKKK